MTLHDFICSTANLCCFPYITSHMVSEKMYFEPEHTRERRIHSKISKKTQKIQMCILQQVRYSTGKYIL